MLHQKSNLKIKISSAVVAVVLVLGLPSLNLHAQEKTTEAASQTQTTKDSSAHKFVEIMPKFNGDFSSFLNGKFHYPDSAKVHNEEGRSVVQFVVDETGEIQNVEVVKSSDYALLDEEAMRIVKSMPKWTPGTQDGKKVKVYYTLPITFKLVD
ncbi:MAG: energy transducer TonB [Chitinophagaceae bacterium]